MPLVVDLKSPQWTFIKYALTEDAQVEETNTSDPAVENRVNFRG
jgi:hypothetical protein